MKKIALTMVITILAFLLAGCGTAKESPDGSVPSDAAEASAVLSEQSSGTESASAAAGDNTVPAGETAGGKGTVSNRDDAFGVVAKSDNAVSGKDKEAVLNELDKELDSLFSNINKLEDVKGSDLELN